MSAPATFTSEQVSQAILAVLSDSERSGHETSASLYWSVAQQLALPRQGRLPDRFTAQVRRVADVLALEGKLRKVGRGQRGPTGQFGNGNSAEYYTPEAWTRAETEAAERAAQYEATTARRKLVADALSEALGVRVLTTRNDVPTLSIDQWERLTSQLRPGTWTATDVANYVGEGFHTAFRKAADSAQADRIHKLITDLPSEEWSGIVRFVAEPLVEAIKHHGLA